MDKIRRVTSISDVFMRVRLDIQQCFTPELSALGMAAELAEMVQLPNTLDHPLRATADGGPVDVASLVAMCARYYNKLHDKLTGETPLSQAWDELAAEQAAKAKLRKHLTASAIQPPIHSAARPSPAEDFRPYASGRNDDNEARSVVSGRGGRGGRGRGRGNGSYATRSDYRAPPVFDSPQEAEVLRRAAAKCRGVKEYEFQCWTCMLLGKAKSPPPGPGHKGGCPFTADAVAMLASGRLN